jgi:ABC-2 type transport system permease protein
VIRVRQVFAIAGLFLRRFIPHPLNLVNIFLLPFVIAVIFGTADERAVSRIPIGAVAVSASASGSARLAEIDREPGVVVRTFANERDLEAALDRGDVAAGVVVADGSMNLLGDPKQPLFAAASAVVQSVAARPQSSTSVSVTNLKTTETSRTNGLPRAAAGMLVFWVFVNALIASSVVAEDKQNGVLTRIASTPVSPSSVVVGDVLARFAICFVQALIVAGLSSLLFGTTWGAVVPFTLLMAMLALTAAAASVLVGMMLRRPGPEAATAASAVAALLGIVGGCFWSLANAPTILQVAGRFTPQAWVLSGIDALVARGAGLADIAGSLAMLVAFATGFLVLATMRLRRTSLRTGLMS